MKNEVFKSPKKASSIILEREIPEGEFDPNNMNVDDINDRRKLVNYYLTDMWGYTPEEISAFSDDDVLDNVSGIYGNINLGSMKNKWSFDEVADHIRSLRGGK